jgi:(1->4)-alpha-D-glucan 1-alpha-D-glucosylmutase
MPFWVKDVKMADEGNTRGVFDRLISTRPSRAPLSTYRIQFNAGFRFKNAETIVEYLCKLGITEIYSSPYYKARSGSTHGYDVTDPTRLNPELGTEEDFDSFCATLKKNGMGLIMDVVPNHMGVAVGENGWWTDVLENGRSSPYARFFDIDWEPVSGELTGKVLLPILGGHYGDVLESGDIKLLFEEGAFFATYFEHRFPTDPSSYAAVLGPCAEAMIIDMGEEDESVLEVMSIITSVRNLPDRDEQDQGLSTERMREKEVVKRRLQSLFESSQDFRVHLQESVRAMNGSPGHPQSFDSLDRLLQDQAYRLSFWQVATEEINYRRFFDINDLAAIRTEDPDVFAEAHRMLLDHIIEGKITGLRIDHPDGLYDPRAYFWRLQEECFIRTCLKESGRKPDDPDANEETRILWRSTVEKDPSLGMHFYIVGEKILMESEKLPPDWPVYGTTGYSFMNLSEGVHVDSHNARQFDGVYNRFTREKYVYTELVYQKKRLILETSMAGEINVLGHRLNLISEKHRRYRDFTLNSLTDAIVETITHFPVYRTYLTEDGINERDIRYIESAIAKARRARPDLAPSVFDFLRDILCSNYPEWADDALRAEWLDFAMRFQQMTGPVMAKGLEDTVFYCYNRLVSLNEVGGLPSAFGIRLEAFHGQNIERAKRWPLTMVATSTHDSKRSEDVRSRISVLSELPGEWLKLLRQWSTLTRKHKSRVHGSPAPDRNDEYLLYQTLLGAWPHRDPDDEQKNGFRDRIKAYMIKAVRESKRNTNWISPDTGYEEALLHFIDLFFENNGVLDTFKPFQKKLSYYGMLNSLSLVLMKTTVPGVPDFYQGAELWGLSLVDPDNRRPVDYATRRSLLAELDRREKERGLLELARDLQGNMENGRIKLYVTSRALRFRKERQSLFTSGEYVPRYADGPFARNIVAYERRNPESSALCVTSRLLTSVVDTGELPVGGTWKDTVLPFPPDEGPRRFTNVFTGQTVETEKHNGLHIIPMSQVFEDFPLALFEDVTGR